MIVVNDENTSEAAPANCVDNSSNSDFSLAAKLKINRKYTDVPCCILFVIWMIMMSAITITALLNGDPSRLIAPKDSRNRPCGYDNMKDKPYLLIADISKCIPRSGKELYAKLDTGFNCDTLMVCIDKCPEHYGIVANFPDRNEYCLDGVWPNSTKKLEVPPGCAGFVLPTVSVLHRCLPLFLFTTPLVKTTPISTTTSALPATLSNFTTTADFTDTLTTNTPSKNLSLTTKWKDGEGHDVDLKKVMEGLKAFARILRVTQKKDELIRDAQIIQWWFLFYFSMPFILSMIYILLLQWVAFPLLMGILILLLIGSAITTTVTVQLYRDPNFSLNETVGNKTIYVFLRKYVYVDDKTLMLTLCILLCLFTLSVFILSCCIFTGIRLACKCMSYASKIMIRNPVLYFFPSVPWLLQFLAFAWFVFTIIYLVSINCRQHVVHLAGIGNITCKNPKFVDLNISTQISKIQVENFLCYYCDVIMKILLSIVIFGYFWLVYFILGFGQLTISICFSQYYWSKGSGSSVRLSVVAAMFNAIQFHSGSIAFGAFLIGLVQFIRVFLEALLSKYRRFEVEQKWFSRIVNLLRVALGFLHSMMQRLNENAYIMISATGENFCNSVRKTLQLYIGSSVKIFIIVNSITFIILIGKCSIAVFTGYLSYLHMIYYFTMIENPIIFAIIICFFAFVYSSVVLGVYSVGVKTILFCIAEDTKHFGGSCVPDRLKKNACSLYD